MYKNLYDCHIHSIHSHDGNTSVEDICRRACEMGLAGLAITDHTECNGIEGQDYIANINHSVSSTRAAQQIFEGRLNVLVGLEIAQILQDIDLANTIADGHHYDFVIGSLHGIGRTIPLFRYWNSVDAVDLDSKVEDYYQQIIELIEWGKFDVLGHLTYPIRYLQNLPGVRVDFSRYNDLLFQVMRLLIESGHGIEINTSGLRQGVGVTMPHLELVKEYRRMGGELITIGSDAHFIEHVGHSIEAGMDILAAAGFKYVTYYKNRKPCFLAVE